MKTVWAYAHVGSNPTLSAKKCSHRQVGTFFADTQDSNPRALGNVPGARFNPRRPAPQRRSNPTLSAIKMFSPSGGNFFCRCTGFEPEGKNKAGVVDSCFIVSLRRERFTGRSAQFLPAPCFRRSLFRFADDAADSLRQSPRINSETGLAKRAAVRSETGKQILRCGLRRITIPKTPREHAWRLSQ